MLKQICVQCNTSSHTLHTLTFIQWAHPLALSLLEQRKLLYSLVHSCWVETAKEALWCCSLSFLYPFHSLFLNSNQTPGLSVPSIRGNRLLTSAHSLASLVQGLFFLMWDVVIAGQTRSTPKAHFCTTHISLKWKLTDLLCFFLWISALWLDYISWAQWNIV